MKQIGLFKTMLMAILMLTFAGEAQAQFGGLGNKLKNKAKEVTKKATTETTEKAPAATATEAAKQTATTATDQTPAATAVSESSKNSDSFSGVVLDKGSLHEITIPEYDRKFTPSAAAKAADPRATSDTLAFNSTKTVGEIHAIYENITDKKIFPFYPYYEWSSYYVMDDPEKEKQQMKIFEDVTLKAMSADLVVGPYVMNTVISETMPDGTKAGIPILDLPRYAWTTRFLCDPTSIGSFMKFAYVLVLRGNLMKASIKYQIDDVNEGIISIKQKLMLPSRDYLNLREVRENAAWYLATEVTDLKLICAYTQRVIQASETNEKGNSPYYACLYELLANEIYQQVIVDHKDYDANDNTIRQIKLDLAALGQKKLLAAVKYKYGEKDERAFPASKMGDAALIASCLKAAKAMYPQEDASAVAISSNEWMIDRDANGNILRRRVAAWVNIKDTSTGARIAREYGFAQTYQGGKYGSTIFYGVGTSKEFYIK